MCGEIDEQVLVGQELGDRLRAAAEGEVAAADLPDLSDDAGRAAYMEAVFRAGVAEAAAAVTGADETLAVDALALRAIALARLAGWLAGQLPPEADLFRAVIEGVTAGHAEPREAAAQAHHHHHDHHHDHSH